jgi:DNA primase
MKLTEQIDEARRNHDIQSVLGTKKKKLVCPLPDHPHKNNTPSFSIFWRGGVQRFVCHGACGAEGDVVDLIGYLRIPFYDRKNGEMVRKALSLLSDRYPIELVVPQKDTVLTGNEWKEMVPPGQEVIEYAAKRGLTEETLKKFKVGQWQDMMTMPCFQEQKCIGIKMRSLTGKRFTSFPGSRQGLFNFDKVNLSTGTVLIAKAEIPCMLLHQLGYTACAPTGGESAWKKSAEWRTALALANKIVIGDNDAPGREMGLKRAALLSAVLKFPPDPYKDWDEWFLAEPIECIQTTNGWIEEACT